MNTKFLFSITRGLCKQESEMFWNAMINSDKFTPWLQYSNYFS